MTERTERLGLEGSLVLVRHGQTACTVAGRFCGAHEVGLTDTGWAMAELLADHPALAEVDRVVCSPSRRAMQTAGLIARARGLTPSVDEQLRELSFGSWEDLLPADVPDPAALSRWERDPGLFAPPGGETGLQVMARAVAAVRDALTETTSRVAVVTHKAPVRLIVSFFLGLPPSRYRELANVPVGSVSHLQLTQGRAVLRGLGDVAHLPRQWRSDPDRAGTPAHQAQ